MWKLSFLGLVLSILMAACGSNKTAIKRYYLIEIPSFDSISSADVNPLLAGYCLLEEIRVYPAYASRQIANRNRSHEIKYYQDHEWAVRPQLFLEHIISDYLKYQRVFRDISTRFWQIEPAYAFETTIYNLEVIEEGSSFAAHVHLAFIIRENATDNILVQHSADVTKPLEKKDLNLLASAVSDILLLELETTLSKLKTRVNRQTN